MSLFLFSRIFAVFFFFFFNDTATTEIYTLSLHDALPICNTFSGLVISSFANEAMAGSNFTQALRDRGLRTRSEEHTSELQSQSNLVCRLLLEKKKKHRHIRKYMICTLAFAY